METDRSCRDIAQRRRYELIHATEARVLRLIADGAALAEVLETLTRGIEAIIPDALASILLLDPDGMHMHNGAAPSLPEAYNRAIDGEPIGPSAGSCGTAMYRREPVIVTDIDSDPLWANYRALALHHGLRACWSIPVMNAEGTCLGSLALYHREPKAPSEADLDFVAQTADLVAIAIEQQRKAEALRISEERFRLVARATTDAVYDWDPVTDTVWWSDGIGTLFDYRSDEVTANLSWWIDRLHPDDKEQVTADLRRLIDVSADEWELTYRFRRRDGRYANVVDRSFVVRDARGRAVRVVGGMTDITARQQAEEALRASEQRFRGLFTDAATGITIMTCDGRFLQANAAYCSMVGYTEDELLQLDFLSLTHPDDRPRNLELLAELLDGQRQSFTLEKRYFHKNGSTVWCRLSVSAQRDAAGQPTGIIGITEDITARKQAEARLQEKESLLRLAGKVAQVGGWAIDPVHHQVYWSNELFDILEWPTDDALELDRTLQIYPPEYRDKVDAALAACVQQGTPFDLELEALTAKGRRIQVRAVGEAERDAAGTITRVVGAFQNISDLKRTERDRQRLANRLQTTLESMSDAFYLLDPEWRFVYLNTEAERVLRRRREELLNQNVWEMFPEARETLVFTEYHHAIETGQSRHFELHYPPLAEWFEVDAHPSAEGLAVYFRSITERKALEDQLRQSQRLESVGQLTGGVAHDFNNLLTVIQGNAELLVEELAAESRLKPLAEMMSSAAQRGAELTRHLLAFARKQALEPRAVDVNRLVHGMAPLLRRTLGEHIEIEFLTAAALWPALIDPGQLESALLNLALNARDAMSQGGLLAIETLNTELDPYYAERHPEVQPGDYVLIAVSDTGCGIPPEQLERVFEPFYTTKGKGTGLGLSMVYGFVKQSDGHVKLYSEPGEGTTVKLYLPRVVDLARTPPEPEPVTEATGGHETILLVEDNALVRTYADGQLKDLGYRVLTAADGPEALEIIRARADIDLLFTDIVMPGGMSGRDLAAAATALRPELKVLYTSGHTENTIVHHGRLDPGVQLLSKPYRRSELARKIRKALDAL